MDRQSFVERGFGPASGLLLGVLRCVREAACLIALLSFPASAQSPASSLRQAAAQRAIPIGAAADPDEYGEPNKLLIPQYANTLSTQ